MGKLLISFVLLLLFSCLVEVHGEDPYLFFDWSVTYGTLSPLGVPQQVILINGLFPGPKINCTSNNNIVVNVFNKLDEPFLLTWKGVQLRKNSWQDGAPGTNCPIPPGKNFTYHFQVKDQIGSYYYHPTTVLHRSVGGYGPITIHSRNLIPVPFGAPQDDFTVLLSDWYTKTHKELKGILDGGHSLGRPDGIVINGKSGKGDGKDAPMYTLVKGKTYRFRFCNVGMKDSINVKIQGHTMKLVEVEGSHTVQNMYELLDIHLGQCLSVLVTADQAPKDYYIVATSRFTKEPCVATAIIHYADGKEPAAPVEKDVPPEGWEWSVNQFNSFRWNLTASAARPNPQGTYHYGQINITRTIRLVSSVGVADGKLRYAINGVSHKDLETPIKLAQYYGIENKVFKYDLIKDEYIPPNGNEKITIAPNVLNVTYKNFVEIILENHEDTIQSWHLDGYNFFAVAIAAGRWKPEMRQNYNLVDAVSRNTIQVYPNSWAAIMTTLDNAGLWNLRSNSLEKQYLGHQLYFSVQSPNRSMKDEYNMPDNNILCGLVKDLPLPKPSTI